MKMYQPFSFLRLRGKVPEGRMGAVWRMGADLAKGGSVREGSKKLFARKLRRDMTDAERRLWTRMRRHQLKGARFRRQVPVGPYIVDFICLEAKLVIEIDGSQHLESASDAVRSDWLERQGFQVLRFWNHDVLTRTEDVLAVIFDALGPVCPHPHPPPQAEEGVKALGSVRESPRDPVENASAFLHPLTGGGAPAWIERGADGGKQP
jgi:very-short-patch-repair endonuclease